MRFVENGPDIPNELIKNWRLGRVIFLAGAGVSVPAGLPLFRELALRSYEAMNDVVFKPASTIVKKRIKTTKSRDKIIEDARLNPKQKVEIELLLSNQLDRLFGAMESRLDYDERHKTKSRHVRDAVERVLRQSTEHSVEHGYLLQLSKSQTINSGEEPICRIATTNFDKLFESAWRAEFGGTPRSFDARMAPRPGAHGFGGIIHLHGQLTDDPTMGSDLILSSRDFARVYLRSGVVANYVYDLMRRFKVVLVGYSADDPPMRYLMDAIAEDASLFEDISFPYALADRDANDPRDANGEIAAERWKTKNILPVLFPATNGPKRFEPLWSTLGSWADWARDDQDWVDRQLADKTSVDYENSPAFSRAFVVDLLSVLFEDEIERAITVLRQRRVDFSWIQAVNAALETGVAQ